MATRPPLKRSPPELTDLLTNLRQEFTAAKEENSRQLIATIAPDRETLRPPVAICEIRAGKEERLIQPNDLFFAAGETSQTDFMAIRDEVISAVEIVESVNDPREGGVRLILQKKSTGPWSDRLRVYIADGNAAAIYQELLGNCFARQGGNDWQPLQFLPTASEGIEALFPAEVLGCPGRSLLTAWFHVPFAFAFFDIAGLNRLGGDAETVKVLLRIRDSNLLAKLSAKAFRINCIPLINRRVDSVHVTLEHTTSFTPLPVATGQVVAGIGKVQLYRGEGDFTECRPWLGVRYPWRHKSLVSARYALSRGTGLNPPSIGLIEPCADLNSPDAHQLHVELLLADSRAHSLASDTEVSSNSRLQGNLVATPSPLLLPAAIDAAELEAESIAAGWLSRDRGGDVTTALRVVLERAAAGLTTLSGGRPIGLNSALSQIDGVLRARTRSTPAIDGVPGQEVTIQLDADRFPQRAPYLFAAVVERALSYFARPLTYTRLIVSTQSGEIAWPPRLPVGTAPFAARLPSQRTASN